MAAHCCSICPSTSATTNIYACPGTFDGADHDVDLVEGTLAARAAGETHHATKSHHHQGVDRLGEGLQVSGSSAMDGLTEAIELPDRRFVLGVQWHPEADEDEPSSRCARGRGRAAHMRERIAEETAA